MLVQNTHLAFWYYLINLPAVYSQRLKASGFSCLWSISYILILPPLPRISFLTKQLILRLKDWQTHIKLQQTHSRTLRKTEQNEITLSVSILTLSPYDACELMVPGYYELLLAINPVIEAIPKKLQFHINLKNKRVESLAYLVKIPN